MGVGWWNTSSAETSLPWLAEREAIQTLRRVWIQHDHAREHGTAWRADDEWPPSALLITSPDDSEARGSRKKSTAWTGYKVHFTETCEDGEPHCIGAVVTTDATTADGSVREELHADEAARERLPSQHLMETGEVDADMLAGSQMRSHVDLGGPVLPDTSWASKAADRFEHSDVHSEWQDTPPVWPAGQMSRDWGHLPDRHGKPSLRVRFPLPMCRACALHDRCTHTAANVLMLRPDEQTSTALQKARTRQDTPECRALYAKRAGIEGTIAHAVRACDMRRARSIGSTTLRLQACFTATAINMLRACAWLADGNHASTPVSRFSRLLSAAQSAAAASLRPIRQQYHEPVKGGQRVKKAESIGMMCVGTRTQQSRWMRRTTGARTRRVPHEADGERAPCGFIRRSHHALVAARGPGPFAPDEAP
jgi:transposase